MAKAYFIEGIPGSGKTTYAKRLHDYLVSQGNQVELYSEGDLHPIDLAWCSIIKRKQFDDLCEKYNEYRDQILSHSTFLEDRVVTAYTKVRVKDKDVSFYDEFSPFEIYRTKDFYKFKNTHLSLWKTFNETHDKEKVYIFECIFLQNHINELILKFNLSKKQIHTYFKDLINTLKTIEKTILYINPVDVKKTFDFVIEERRSNNKNYKDWIDQVIEYFENSKYGKKKGYIGYEGALQYFKDRQKLETNLLKELEVENFIFNQEQDYNSVFKEITLVIEK